MSTSRLVRTSRPLPDRPPSAGDHHHRAWVEATAAVHRRYRASLRAQLGDASGATIAVICVTRRPALLDEVIANFTRQAHPDRELIVVTNAADFDEAVTRARVAAVPRGRVVRTDAARSLGSCLNLAIEMTDVMLIAKFDDDDRYGAHYLTDALLAQRALGAAVVGKHSYFAHLAASDRSVLRFPGHELIESRFLAGGTLLFDRAAIGDVRFPDRSVGEDGGFLDACWRGGLGVFAADQFNYLQRRGSDNAWQISDDQFSANALDLGPGERLDLIDV